ncbi:hypothetical protein BEL04_14425 [Mucilaginibacter sp. PPCGB 2223]|uniref:hypothetical protein n=1 Tax=Mucilaginibacter sp. PPCGB 2223 TaxID=1886027 RepID=UPI000824342B|nr:hypothetical protein [Mucilaginibacter sp. PPCGB 2223]OCX52638.1 hypothetical protein BEL04_14425 [Mucilaginibacter sp. PPCGB 2223]
MKNIKHCLFSFSLYLIALTGIFSSSRAFGQIDFFYGKNTHGLRIGAGAGLAGLVTHYNSNPLQLVYDGSLDYDFNPYLSIGIEGQYGTLKGVDTYEPHHQYYTSSTNKFRAANINLKAALGLFYDFYPNNAFQDALKRMYIGVGFGKMKDKISFTYDPERAQYVYGTPHTYDLITVVPFSFGTYIDLPNLLGYDRIEINPNYQFTFMDSMYSDGYISNQYSHLKGFYNMVSINIKYKF